MTTSDKPEVEAPTGQPPDQGQQPTPAPAQGDPGDEDTSKAPGEPNGKPDPAGQPTYH